MNMDNASDKNLDGKQTCDSGDFNRFSSKPTSILDTNGASRGNGQLKRDNCGNSPPRSLNLKLVESEWVQSNAGTESRQYLNSGYSDQNSYADDPISEEDATIENMIGSFGWFQLCILIFSGLRECTLSYDAVIMSVVLQPVTDFDCQDRKSQLDSYDLLSNGSVSSELLPEQEQCFIGTWTDQYYGGAQQLIPCSNWTFPNKSASISMIAKWSLVCQNHWYVAVIESAFFAGMLVGNIVWGYTADIFGRRQAYIVSHVVALVSGSLGIFAPTVWTLVACRFFLAAGNVGNYVLCSLQMELIGTKHRSFSTMLYHVGWGLGLVVVPVVYHQLDDYHMILAVTPITLLALFPFAYWLPESPRWLLTTKGDIDKARVQIIKAAQFNCRPVTNRLDKQIALMEQRIRSAALTRKGVIESEGTASDGQVEIGYQEPYSTLITNRVYFKDTVILGYSATLASVFYYYLTINFAYTKDLSLEANFVGGGVSEWLTCILGATMLRFVRRKTLVTIFVIILALSFVVQAAIDSESIESSNMDLIVTSNNAIGTVAAVSIIFVIIIASQEVYPTSLRQRGSSIINTMNAFGSCLAPPLIHIIEVIDDWRMNFVLVIPCLICAFVAHFLTVTDECELQDT